MQTIGDNIPFLVLLAMTGTALLVLSFILFIIHNNNKLLKQKKRLQDAELQYQKDLLYAVIDSQEKERQRIGMDLHDEVGSALSSLRIIQEGFMEKIKNHPDSTDYHTKSKKIIDNVIQNVRNISHDLSPLGKGVYELPDALNDLCDRINQSAHIHMTLSEFPDEINQLNNSASLALYRVLTELVNNTLKHAGANEISCNFSCEQQTLLITYRDNGKGITSGNNNIKPGIGMKNIESRLKMMGATYSIHSERGFEMKIKIPIVMN